MGRRAALSVALFVVLASCVPIWRDVKSEAGGFTVEFPGTPEEAVGIQQAPFGDVEARDFAFVAGRWGPFWIALYTVSTFRPREELPGADEGLRWQYDKTLEVFNSDFAGVPKTEVEVVDDRPISLNGHPGREFTILTRDGTQTRVRIYYVDGTVYRLMTDDGESRAERFLESFELL